MKRLFVMMVLIGSCLYGFSQYSQEDQIYDYIDKYKDLAMKEMEQYKVPASITLAQAIYATNAGTNKVSVEANNHFGITCHSNEWSGATYYAGENRGDDYCFRKYATVADSYRDHSLFISQRSRYNRLFYLPITDYKSWAHGLSETGYSGNPRYADTLITLIEKYYLAHYDRKVAAKLGDTTALKVTPAPVTKPIADTKKTVVTPTPPVAAKPAPQKDTLEMSGIQVIVNKSEKTTARRDTLVQTIPAPKTVHGIHIFTLNPLTVPFKQAYYPYTNRPVFENNKTKFLLAKAGDTYKSLAVSMQMNEKNLRLYNDVYDDSEPVENEVVYIEMKSTKSSVSYHTLEQGDTYRYIAQKYGIQLKLIIKRNSGAISSYDIGDKICIGCK